MESIFVNEEVNLKIAKEVDQATIGRVVIPAEYLEVKLDSLGRFDAPSVLHFRNYSMEEAIDLASAGKERYLETLINCLNKMIFEQFDCALLLDTELEEIMCYLYKRFWGNELENYTYYIDDTIVDEELKNAENNIGLTNIEISKLTTIVIDSEFKEPITISIENKKVGFKLPRLKNMLDAKLFIDKKYFEEERKLSDVKSNLDKDLPVTFEQNKAYNDLQIKKSQDMLKAYESSIIYSYEGATLDTLEEKMKVFSKIGLPFWKRYEKVVSEKGKFGINPNYTFLCNHPSILEKFKEPQELTRRFAFQSMDFIPPVELSDDSGAIVSFGN